MQSNPIYVITSAFKNGILTICIKVKDHVLNLIQLEV